MEAGVEGPAEGAPRLSRAAGHRRAAAPVRIVHLGLGNFFRAHQAAYTHHAPDAEEWGIAAYGGRGAGASGPLAEQDGLYSLVTRSPDADQVEVIGSISRAHAGTDLDRWLRDLASPDVAVVTTTITEAGYRIAGEDDPHSASRRLVDGLVARRKVDAGPLALVPCDNLPDNGRVLEGVLRQVAEAVDPSLVGWMDQNVSVVSTVVDRITPRPGPGLEAAVREATGLLDHCPVVTEPFGEWLLAGAFPGGRPAWEGAGAVFVDDVAPFERRKLWLLNGAHSLLAYAGPPLGHRTVAEAIGDPTCRAWVETWWDEAAAHLDLPEEEVDAYRAALLQRFANHRIEHRLAQIAADGSLKIPVRVLPVLRAERAAGRLPSGASLVLAAWTCHLRGMGAPVQDPAADALRSEAAGRLVDAVPKVLAALEPELADDRDLCAAVAERCREVERWSGR